MLSPVVAWQEFKQILHSLFHSWAYESFSVIAKSLELRGCMNMDNRLTELKRYG